MSERSANKKLFFENVKAFSSKTGTRKLDVKIAFALTNFLWNDLQPMEHRQNTFEKTYQFSLYTRITITKLFRVIFLKIILNILSVKGQILILYWWLWLKGANQFCVKLSVVVHLEHISFRYLITRYQLLFYLQCSGS